MRLGHISDLHLLDLSGARWTDFLNKRWTGGVNLLLARSKKHGAEVAEKAVKTIRKYCDHLIVTGDLTNLAFETEFFSAKKLLNACFDDSEMTIVPGNHDFYTRESVKARRFERIILGLDEKDECTWPKWQLLPDNIALISLNSALPRPWFMASGRLGRQQRDGLCEVLEKPEVSGKFRIVALHHHVFREKTTPGEWTRNLRDGREFLDIIKRYSVDMVVFGHNHRYYAKKWNHTIFAEPGSCSVRAAKSESGLGKFNVYNISGGALVDLQTWRYANGEFSLWKTWTTEDLEV